MASRLQDVLLRGLAASRPAATAVAAGTLYYATDTATTTQSDGATWNTYADAATTTRTGALEAILDGGGSALTTGVKLDLYVPFACTITASTLIADQTGSIVLDVLKSSAFSTTPTVSIVASAPPTLSSAAAGQDATLTGWTTAVAAGSRLRLSVTSVSTITRLTYALTVTVP